jgi:CRP/FNR family cyclic AMP-dependent transcriptional regulator
MKRRFFRIGETVFRAGDISDCAYLVISGSVNIDLPSGRRKNLGAGEIFGEMGLLDNRPRSATATAAEHTELAAYSETELLDAIRSRPDEAVGFIRALIGRLREANDAGRRDGLSVLLTDNF